MRTPDVRHFRVDSSMCYARCNKSDITAFPEEFREKEYILTIVCVFRRVFTRYITIKKTGGVNVGIIRHEKAINTYIYILY